MPHSGPTRRSSSLIYHPGLLKPGSARWRAALLAARLGKPCLPLPGPGLTLVPAGEKFDQMGARIAGFRGFGDQMLRIDMRSEEHTSELQSLMRISYAVFCLKNKTTPTHNLH